MSGKLLIVVLLVCSLNAGAQQVQPPATPITEAQPQVTPMLLMKKSVVFIQATYKKRSEKDVCVDEQGKPTDTCRLIGTGFFVIYPDERFGQSGESGFTYIVTNKHLVREPGKDDEVLGHGPYLPSVAVRINTKKPLQESGVQFTFAPLGVTYPNGDLHAFVHPDDSAVDLAVLPISVNVETLDFFMLSPHNFATPKVMTDQKFDESNEVVFAGLFASYTGANRNYPIVRHGKLAMISSERIPWMPGQTEDLILADVMSFGGNSGSPVFIRTGGDGGPIGSNTYYLLGIMQGFYTVDSQVSIQTAQANGVAKENTGIAAVIPTQKLIDILQSPRAQAARDIAVAQKWFADGKEKEAIDLAEATVNRLVEFDSLHQDLIQARYATAALLTKAGDHVQAALQIKAANLIKRTVLVSDDAKK